MKERCLDIRTNGTMMNGSRWYGDHRSLVLHKVPMRYRRQRGRDVVDMGCQRSQKRSAVGGRPTCCNWAGSPRVCDSMNRAVRPLGTPQDGLSCFRPRGGPFLWIFRGARKFRRPVSIRFMVRLFTPLMAAVGSGINLRRRSEVKQEAPRPPRRSEAKL
jgi:hypothetical protein